MFQGLLSGHGQGDLDSAWFHGAQGLGRVAALCHGLLCEDRAPLVHHVGFLPSITHRAQGVCR